MKFHTNSTSKVLDQKSSKEKYPEVRVMARDDNRNTFEHIAKSILFIIPGINEKVHGNMPSKLISQALLKYGEESWNKQSNIMNNWYARD